MKMRLFTIVLLVCTVGCAFAREPVAVVLGDRIYRNELEPDKKTVDFQKQFLSAKEFDEWQRNCPGQRLSQLIYEPLMRRYMDENGLTVSDKELITYLKPEDEPWPTGRLDSREKALYRTVVENSIFAKSLFEKHRGRVAVLDLGALRALDAQETFLRQQLHDDAFAIFDSDLAKAFWAAITNESGGTTLTEQQAQEMLDQPKYRRLRTHKDE